MAQRQRPRPKQITPSPSMVTPSTGDAALRDESAATPDEPALAADINVLSDSLVRETLAVSRDQKIEQAAYRLAEQRGFEAGHELEDWLQAEKQVDTELSNAGVLNRESIPA
jgi:hypothetical protein